MVHIFSHIVFKSLYFTRTTKTQFDLATLQVASSHMWLAAIVLGGQLSSVLKHKLKKR